MMEQPIASVKGQFILISLYNVMDKMSANMEDGCIHRVLLI